LPAINPAQFLAHKPDRAAVESTLIAAFQPTLITAINATLYTAYDSAIHTTIYATVV
jgi:hypothetical protein